MARTNIELPDELVGWLKGEAARRGLRGFSAIVEEALEKLRGGPGERERRVKEALEARIPEKEGEDLERHVREVRARWGRRGE